MFGFEGVDIATASQKSKLVLIAVRVHPFPSRTRKLSSLAPKILVWRRTGKIGNANIGNRTVNWLSCFFVVIGTKENLPSKGRLYNN